MAQLELLAYECGIVSCHTVSCPSHMTENYFGSTWDVKEHPINGVGSSATASSCTHEQHWVCLSLHWDKCDMVVVVLKARTSQSMRMVNMRPGSSGYWQRVWQTWGM